jgi:hypothetical protein
LAAEDAPGDCTRDVQGRRKQLIKHFNINSKIMEVIYGRVLSKPIV